MNWNYSGDPSASDLDKYRFLIGDTDEAKGLLQDEEIQFILDQWNSHNYRMYKLFEILADKFGKAIKRKLGPQSEDPTGRTDYYRDKMLEYKRLAESSLAAPSMATSKKLFYKGMHDNV